MTRTSSSQWVQLIDCGGLIHVSEECHQLFLSAELLTHHHTYTNNLEMLDGGSQQHLINLKTLDDNVLFNWTVTGGDKVVVLKEIVQLWITIRGNSFAKSIMEKYKKKARR